MATKTGMLLKPKVENSKNSSMKKAEVTNNAKMKQNTSSLLMLTSQLVSIGRFNKGLPSFITRGLDLEQIWQQLELRNEHNLSIPTITKEIVKITTHSHKKHKRKGKVSSEEILDTDKHLENGESDSSEEEENILKSVKERLEEKSESKKQDDLDIGGDDVDSDELDFDFELDNEIATGLSDNESEKKTKKKQINKPTEKRKTVVDDKFFKLSEMEEFLEVEDLKEAKKIRKENRKKDFEENDDDDTDDSDEGEEIDMFTNLDSEDENDPMYKDFFDPPANDGSEREKTKAKDVKLSVNEEDENEIDNSDLEDDDEDENNLNFLDENDDVDAEKPLKKKVAFTDDLLQSDEETLSERKQKENKSTFELKQEQLLAKAREMEELSIKEVSWELLGEAAASKRPENSLLETVLDFQHTTRAAPVITEETTKTLEDYIKQRIKDKTFDDVERKEKKKEEVFEFKKRIVLDQEKSKISLGELYEQEFIKQQQQEKNEVKADPECEKIEKELYKLFHQLDALSNFRYTPMKPGTEVKIIVNTPAITMEEVAPVATTDADLLAPEEVLEKNKGELKADDERTSTDKKRARRLKKVKKRARKKAKDSQEKLIEKLNPGLGNKHSKAKALKQLEQRSKTDKNITLIKGEQKKLSSSTSFFTQLQEEVQSGAKAKKVSQTKVKKTVNAAKLML